MDENTVAQEFRRKLDQTFQKSEELYAILSHLRSYSDTGDLPTLINSILQDISHPSQLRIFDDLRYIISTTHQFEYFAKTPAFAEKTRVIKISRYPDQHSFGFSLRGGREMGTGIFVSSVEEGSPAFKRGIHVGDQIESIDRFSLHRASLFDTIKYISKQSSVLLRVKQRCLLPANAAVGSVTWLPISDTENAKLVRGLHKVYANLSIGSNLGCTIANVLQSPHNNNLISTKNSLILIEHVRKGSIAQELGLQKGDWVLEVNGVKFRSITPPEAIIAIKSKPYIDMSLLRPHPVREGFLTKSRPSLSVDKAEQIDKKVFHCFELLENIKRTAVNSNTVSNMAFNKYAVRRKSDELHALLLEKCDKNNTNERVEHDDVEYSLPFTSSPISPRAVVESLNSTESTDSFDGQDHVYSIPVKLKAKLDSQSNKRGKNEDTPLSTSKISERTHDPSSPNTSSLREKNVSNQPRHLVEKTESNINGNKKSVNTSDLKESSEYSPQHKEAPQIEANGVSDEQEHLKKPGPDIITIVDENDEQWTHF